MCNRSLSNVFRIEVIVRKLKKYRKGKEIEKMSFIFNEKGKRKKKYFYTEDTRIIVSRIVIERKTVSIRNVMILLLLFI